MTSPSSGYITMGRNESENDRRLLQRDVTIPFGHVLMISFKRLSANKTTVTLNYTEQYRSSYRILKGIFQRKGVWTSTDFQSDIVRVYQIDNTRFTVQVSSDSCNNGMDPIIPCFQLFFTYFAEGEVPQKLSSGFWNCSTEHYSRFQHHMKCNLKKDCEDGRDETEYCPFSSLGCQGLVALCDRCYKVVRYLSEAERVKTDGNKRGNDYCKTFGGKLGFPSCAFDTYRLLVKRSRRFWGDLPILWAGLRANDMSLPNMYRHSIHNDKTVFFHLFRSTLSMYDVNTYVLLSLQHWHIMMSSRALNMWYLHFPGAICEIIKNKTDVLSHHPKVISLPKAECSRLEGLSTMAAYYDDQMTHTFLLCGSSEDKMRSQEYTSACYFHQRSRVNKLNSSTSAVSAPTFTCSDGLTTFSYTLVCDFGTDCPDSSDESFCRHSLCFTAFTCTNGQCLAFDNVCDQISHCHDGSEEDNCLVFYEYESLSKRFPSPALIIFDGIRRFSVLEMDVNESCPDSHYRCPRELNDCLPVYTRCNGMYDCTGHDDEDNCGEMTCPGLFRCRRSTTCLHSDHICDGWSHCPQRDDELWCNVACPVACLCQVHTFLCPEPFRSELFPQVRSLDGTGSGMTLSDVSSNAYLVHLVLCKCSLTHLPEIKLLNLKLLDLSDNKFQRINMTSFLRLENMRSLSLSNNPIMSIHTCSSSITHHNLPLLIDLSHTAMTVFDSQVLEHLPLLQKLNLTFTTIHTISSNNFQFTLQLTELYMEGSPIETFTLDVFKDLFNLRFISAQNYKLCCDRILPRNFDASACMAPKDEISSCEDLLQSWIYRGFLWLITCLSVTGNLFCFCARTLASRITSSSGFSVLVTNLTMADFVMGVYMAVIGVADECFRGRYLHLDDTWKSSAACKVAGFLCLLSSEVSALIICLITLDRFIVLCFPFSTMRLERTSASTVCLLVWLSGWFIAVLPLLPVASHWAFYSQTGICIPLPVTRQEFKGKSYSFGVMIILNFVLFVLISMGQALIYWSIQQNTLRTSSTSVSQDMTIAQRLITIALTDFLCWFPIGLCGMLALTGLPVPGEVNVALAIFILPLNSAINPFMYTFNTLAEKRRKQKESELLKWAESHADVISA